jgi:hypothetical protein
MLILENPTAHEQRWLVGLTLSLVVSLIAVAWINRQPLCIESEIIRKLEYRADGAAFDLHRCQARQHIGFEDVIADRLPQLNRRLQMLELEGEYFLGAAWKQRSFTVLVSDAEPDPKADSSQIQLTSAELDVPAILESRILDRVLRQNLRAADGPSAELLSIYFQALTGYLPVETELKRLEPADWKLALYGEAVRRTRSLLPIGEQRAAFDEWRELLNEKDSAPWALPMRVQQLMHESLAAFGYRQDLRIFQIPFAVMWPDRNVMISDLQMEKIHHLMSAVILPDQISFPFSLRQFSRVNAAPIQVGRLVLFQCGVPRLDELEKIGVEFEHLLFVQNCEQPDVKLVLSALRNARSFVVDYPHIDFVQIHWPSLRLALERTGVKETSLAGLFRKDSLENFKRLGFLSRIEQDPVTGIRSWKGPIEPFGMFRISGGKAAAKN